MKKYFPIFIVIGFVYCFFIFVMCYQGWLDHNTSKIIEFEEKIMSENSVWTDGKDGGYVFEVFQSSETEYKAVLKYGDIITEVKFGRPGSLDLVNYNNSEEIIASATWYFNKDGLTLDFYGIERPEYSYLEDSTVTLQK